MMLIASDFIWPLDRFGKTGYIHSVFGRSLNFCLGTQLIHVSTYPGYLSSFGVYVPLQEIEQLLQASEVGNLIKLRCGEIIFYTQKGVYKISCHEVMLFSLYLPKATWDLTYSDQFMARLASENLDSQLGIVSSLQTKQIFNNLVQSEELITEEVMTLIGRGKGLTPSGDDILMGYLATLCVFQEPRGKDLKKMMQQTSLNTTAISLAYLNALLQEVVSLPLYEFFESFVNKMPSELLWQRLEQLLRIGHTSGKDTAYGVYLGLSYCQNRNGGKVNGELGKKRFSGSQ